ncbi:hypothetical protein FNV43_RR10903 [Rhamnella rubrinervis]|uniref:glucan endo-1,3-beta-D-glucosidase n=1 Tax=Rhamnella rubrinervis TaxID=2594499 RepID=A0A8K0H4M4_9ROSA|nr:hypothetical protein FNV43_RR10903 [Rhamnella rubrinervis]
MVLLTTQLFPCNGSGQLLEPDHQVLKALRSSNLQQCPGVRNPHLKSISLSQSAAAHWVQTYVLPCTNQVSFGWITLGNEAIPGPNAKYVASAMSNMHLVLNSVGLVSTRITAVVPMEVLKNFNPPSARAFSEQSLTVMNDVAASLLRTGSPLMVNVYPYFAYALNPKQFSYEYATFIAKQPVVDGHLKYYSPSDAMVDGFYAALEKINAGNVTLCESETGWPTAAKNSHASPENAKMYNANLCFHVVNNGTPRRPNNLLDTFLFEMLDEKKKPGGAKQHFGLFHKNLAPAYRLFDTCK